MCIFLYLKYLYALLLISLVLINLAFCIIYIDLAKYISKLNKIQCILSNLPLLD